MDAQTLIEELKPRAQRLGLTDPATGFIDQDELAFYVADAVRYLTNRYQLQHLLKINRELLRTVAGLESYELPDNYAFVAPLEARRSGFAVSDSDGTNTVNLEYYDVARYELIRTSQTGKPAWYTLATGLLYLQPVPDTIYVIEAIERPLQSGDVIPAPYAAAIAIQVLFRMASDQGKITQSLVEERTELLRTLINNEQRARQRFYVSYERPGFGRGRRRYGL